MARIDFDPVDATLSYWLAVLENTGNPLAAWKAYHVAREAGRPIPPAVLAELDRVSSELFADTGAAETRAGRVVMRAARGRADAWSELERLERDVAIYGRFHRLQEAGMSDIAAYASLAGTHEARMLSADGVRKAVAWVTRALTNAA